MERLSLAARELQNDLGNFQLLKYARRVDGFLVTAKNSGSHWARFMLSTAIASHLGLPPPARSSGPQSDVFIGHAKHPRVHADAPRIGSSHNIPSRLLAGLARVGLFRMPPTVLLVRDIPQALLSYYAKWREPYALGRLSEFLRRPAPGGRKVEDAWWFIRFFRAWSGLRRAAPAQILVVRYEDLAVHPERWIRRIWAHWGVTLDDADVAAALAVASREAVAARLDPEYGEAIVRMAGDKAAPAFSAADMAFLHRLLDRHLGPHHERLTARPGRLQAAEPARGALAARRPG